jgi:DNA-binding NarL/FixJ family response regulator
VNQFSRALLIEPSDIVRAGIVSVIQRVAPHIVIEEAGSYEAALAAAVRGPWSVIVIEPAFPAGDGVELLTVVCAANADTPTLVFSSGTEGRLGLAAMQAGARGFLSKMAARTELVAALAKLAEGGLHMSDGLQNLVSDSQSPFGRARGYAALSEGERFVLAELARGRTAKEIAVAGRVTSSTVGTHRARILVKLGLRTTADLIRYAVEHRLHAAEGRGSSAVCRGESRHRVVGEKRLKLWSPTRLF